MRGLDWFEVLEKKLRSAPQGWRELSPTHGEAELRAGKAGEEPSPTQPSGEEARQVGTVLELLGVKLKRTAEVVGNG